MIKIHFLLTERKYSSQPGFEPGTFGLEVQRAIHCATGTDIRWKTVIDFECKGYAAHCWNQT